MKRKLFCEISSFTYWISKKKNICQRNIKDIVKDSFIRKIKSKVKVSEYNMNLIGDYIGSGIAKILKDWFENPGDMSASDIAVFASTLIYGGVRGVIDAGDKIEGSGK